MQTTHIDNGKAVLALSLELCKANWKIAGTDGRREKPSLHTVAAARAQERLEQVTSRIDTLKSKWGLPVHCEVWILYEAGQDGFWIARALQALGYRVLVVDPASVPVTRQARRAKTDRLDALALLDNLLAWLRGERRHELRMVKMPSEEAQAQRQLSRERGLLQKEICQHRDRVRKLLRVEGCWDDLHGDVRARLDAGELRAWNGQALSAPLVQRLQRELERLQQVQRQFTALEKQLLQQLPEPLQQRIAQLAQLRGVGWVGAMRLVLELYWRNFQNRRQVGSCVGLVSQPYDSGSSRVDQGISKQGNRRVRALLIEMAWMWLRHQPNSALAKWYAERVGGNAQNKRGKRIAVVAVARRLAIALWRYLEQGVIPAGAQLKRA
jgi:transposase